MSVSSCSSPGVGGVVHEAPAHSRPLRALAREDEEHLQHQQAYHFKSESFMRAGVAPPPPPHLACTVTGDGGSLPRGQGVELLGHFTERATGKRGTVPQGGTVSSHGSCEVDQGAAGWRASKGGQLTGQHLIDTWREGATLTGIMGQSSAMLTRATTGITEGLQGMSRKSLLLLLLVHLHMLG